MLFNSLQFLIFFILVAAGFALVRRHLKLRNSFLLLASYVFYGAWDWRFLSLILLSTIVDYSVSNRLPAAGPRRQRLLVILSLVVNLGVLATFKYLDFGIESLAEMASWIGWELHIGTLGIILPVGISFYTFQTIGYTLDVAAGRRKPVRSFLDFALFVAYFPQLVAGPIERSTVLLPQLQELTRPGWPHFRRGLLWVLSGYFLKVVCADTIAPLVDEAYARADMIGGPVLFLATWGFAVQIFGDFAGYTLIARGISEWFGIRLMENFRSPYISQSPREFWQRWHISLSTWFQQYLYTPLALVWARRNWPLQSALPVFLTMTLIGLWHGAGWNFILFGAFWGAWLGGYALYQHALVQRSRKVPDCLAVKWFQNKVPGAVPIKVVAVFLGTLASFVLFRSPDLATAIKIFIAILTDWHLDPSFGFYLRSVGLLFGIIWAYGFIQHRTGNPDFLLDAPPLVRWSAVAFVLLTLLTVGFRPVPFIYFQF
jgi:alginate O-acetyltransferase complex protein AlgI